MIQLFLIMKMTVMESVKKWNLTQYDFQKEEKNKTMAINIIKKTGTHGMYHQARQIKYLVIHYTAGVTSKVGTARNTASWFANPRSGGTADFIVDDGEIVQYNPDPLNYACWAVGGRKYNNQGGSLYNIATNINCISIEICSSNKTGKVTNPNDNNWYFTDAVINNAIALSKYLMQTYNITIDRVIRHYDVNGKPCPGVYGWNVDSGSEAAWNNFKSRLGGGASVTPSIPAQPSAQPAAANTVPSGSFTVDVLVNDLNIRKTPNGEKTGKVTGKGKFTIVQTQNGWGLLKSYAKNKNGWIYLKNSQYVKINQTTPATASTASKNTTMTSSISYVVQVTANALNYRQGPGTNYKIMGTIKDRGRYTIVEEKNGWGLLKAYSRNKNGWISLKYTKRV